MLPLKKYLAAAFISVTAISAGLLAAPAPSKWLSTVTVTANGAHVLGNPAAPNKVVEYLSYTCSHCANFEANESPAFKAQYVATGKASLEIRNMVLNPIDLTAAVLARCGGKAKFFGNHKQLFSKQSVWLGKTKNIMLLTSALGAGAGATEDSRKIGSATSVTGAVGAACVGAGVDAAWGISTFNWSSSGWYTLSLM